MGFEIVYALTDLSALEYTRFGAIRDGAESGRWIRHHMTLGSLQSNSKVQYMLADGTSGSGNSYTELFAKDTDQHILKLDTVNKTFTYDGTITSYTVN